MKVLKFTNHKPSYFLKKNGVVLDKKTKKVVIAAMEEFAFQETWKDFVINESLLRELKPLEDVYRKENPSFDMDGKEQFYCPDTRTFYKWIVNKIIKNEL